MRLAPSNHFLVKTVLAKRLLKNNDLYVSWAGVGKTSVGSVEVYVTLRTVSSWPARNSLKNPFRTPCVYYLFPGVLL
jgi:hypothetical protein